MWTDGRGGAGHLLGHFKEWANGCPFGGDLNAHLVELDADVALVGHSGAQSDCGGLPLVDPVTNATRSAPPFNGTNDRATFDYMLSNRTIWARFFL
jgi:hypothetical protein